jgi:dolichyl-phosphate-mannose-protein mannosyltransferase
LAVSIFILWKVHPLNSRNALIVFFISFFFLLIWVQLPSRLVFDEKFYVPASEGILKGAGDVNYQHPPLAKEMMALSVSVFGDSPLGWRWPSMMMGAVTLASLYFLGLLFFESSFLAATAVILSFSGGIFFTLSRLALLEIFSFGFATLAVTFFLYGLYTSKEHRVLRSARVAMSGLFFGLALASKWSAVVPWAVCLAGGLLARKLTLRQTASLIAQSLVFYFIPFGVLLLLSGKDLNSFLPLQQAMWDFHHPAVPLANIDMANVSPWWEWALRVQPMWLAVLPPETPDPRRFLGVMIFGNPFVIWAGWLGLLACFSQAWKRTAQAYKPRWILALTLAPYLFWAVNPRTMTYYYYFLPTSVLLAFALVYALANQKHGRRLVGALTVLASVYFIYHLPLMTAQEFSKAQFEYWYPHLKLFGD